MKIKAISYILAFALTAVTAHSFSAAAANASPSGGGSSAGQTENAQMSVLELSCRSDRQEVKRGGTVTYTLNLDSIGMSRGFQMSIAYDASVMTLVDSAEGELLTDVGFASGINTDIAGIVGISCVYDIDRQETGTVAELTFKVNESVPDGYIGIEIGSTYTIDSDYRYIDAEVVGDVDSVFVGRLPREYELTLYTDKASYLPGDTLYLTADLGDLDEFLGIQFTIGFDTSKFEYITPSRNSEYYESVMRGASTKSLNSSKVADGKLEVLAGYGSKQPYSGGGKVCTVAFKVLSAAPGDAVFDIIKCVPGADDVCVSVPAEVYVASGTVYDVIDKINEIGTVTVGSGAKISAARAMYESLSAEDKALVVNYAVLTAAESKYYQLLPVFDYSYTVNGSNIAVSVKNNKCENDAPLLIIAQYDENGVKTAVDLKTLTIEKGASTVYNVTKLANSTNIKLMLWNDINSMKPYRNK